MRTITITASDDFTSLRVDVENIEHKMTVIRILNKIIVEMASELSKEKEEGPVIHKAPFELIIGRA